MTQTDVATIITSEQVHHFNRGARENPIFWSRFVGQPALTGLTVMDVGSGWGSLCVDIAHAGAQRVIGLDINTRLVEFAQVYSRQQFPELSNTLEFAAEDLQRYAAPVMFDLIVSKDSFEHIIDLDGMLAAMKARLKPGGRIYAGFGPLYPTPYGDHDRRQNIFRPWGVVGSALAALPWGHLMLERQMIALYNRHRMPQIESMYDLGLNKRGLSDYQRAFAKSGLRIVSLRTNCSTSPQSRALTVARRILPVFSDYLTHNIYCILEKP
jgi:SAM-dependent methyltransferase